MMTAVDVNVGDLLKVGEEEFDSAIKAMTVKNLMSVISGLQREMSREQEAFNSLSGELQKNKGRNSRQYKQISKDMVASQQKLTLLMNRSMKCFAQQNSPITNSSNGGGSDANSSGLRRRNSAKGPIGHAPPSSVGVSSGADSPVAAVSSRTAAISRSKSMHSVNHPGSPSTRPQPSLIASSSSSNSSSNNASKPTSKPLIMHASRPLNNATSSGGSTSTTTLPTSSTNTNANASSSASKPHTPIIMKPSAANGSANLVSSTKTSHPQTSTALTSNNTSAPTRASTSSSLTPHIPTAGSTSTTSVPASNGVSVATTNPLNSDLQGTTNVQGSEGSSRENKQGQGAGTLGGGGTGMYVKRRSGVPSSRPASTSYAVYSSAIASSSQPAPSQIASSSSSFASASLPPRAPAQSRGRLQIVGSTRPATNSNTAGVSPMLLSQPLSKSQGAIHHNHLNLSSEQTPDGNTSSNGTGTAASNDEFRGLPSVRQLAQSFGSMTALNTASSSSSGYTRNPRYVGGGAGRSSSSLVFSPGKGVARSSSSVGFLRGTPSSPSSSSSAFSSSPSASVSTQRLFLTNKGNNANNTNDDSSIKNGSDETQQHDQTSTNLPQQTPFVSKHLNGTAVAQHPPAAQQQEQKQQKQQQQQQRIRPLSVGRAPMSSSSFSIPTSSSSSTSDVESQLALARAKLKNRGSRGITADTAESFVNTAVTAPASESPSASFTSPSPAVSSTSNEISNGQPQSPTDTASSVKLSLVRNNVTGNGSASNVNTDHNSTSASDRTGSATKPTTYSPPLLSSPPPPPKTVNSNNMIYNNNNEDTKTTVSTSNASNNLRRSKSRDELVEQAPASTRLYRQAKKPTSGRETLLQQIQARRRYDDDDDVDGGSSKDNFRAVSKLSMSMPSLLQTDPDQGDGSKERPIKSSVVLPPKLEMVSTPDGRPSHDPSGGSGGATGGTTLGQHTPDMGDPVEQASRMNLRDWDPTLVIEKLYELKLMDEQVEDISHQFVSMEGLMEKLPMNKKKATLLKTWKRRFFRAKDGWLYYYETSNRDRPSETIQLMGGNIIDLGNRVLGIDDGRGRYLMVRCPTEKEHGQWVVALESQTADNTKATYVRPALAAARHPKKKIVVIDLGSSSIRAGVLGDQASLPELFIPSVVAVDPKSGKVLAVGQDALAPFMRQKCNLVYPIRPSNKVDQFNIEVPLMGAIFSKVFQELKVKPADYWVMLSTPQNLGDPLKQGLMQMLVDELNVAGVCMVQQALLSLYSYNATSGIIVDIGHRIEILPIFDGFIIDGGMARCPYGAQKVQESLTTSLLHNNYTFRSETEQLLVRYIMEDSCYVAIDYGQEEEFCKDQPQTIRTTVNLAKFKLPEGAYQTVEHDLSRFKSPEGFFNVDLWEMDYPTLQKLIHRAIQTCPMDNRRHMWRAVFLSGGVTMLPGFAERLERELTKLAPPGVPVEVHAAPQRYHAAFVGACSVALMPQFEASAISREEWRKEGCRAFRKWQGPT